MAEKLTVWVVTEGLAGTENQCLGIAEALGSPPLVKRIALRWPWSWVSPYLSWGEGPWMLSPAGDQLAPPWPDVVIAGGRKAIGIARYIRRASQGHTLVAVVQSPYVCPSAFDLTAVPHHDGLTFTRGNVLVTDGAPNRITAAKLAQARLQWADRLGALPGPRLAVLIGGNSKTHRLGTAQMDDLIAKLSQLCDHDHFSMMITLSRRTPADLADKLRQAITSPGVYIWDGQGDNPYFGLLAWADAVLVTSDSASMLSDAATTGKPVILHPLPGGSAKFDRLYRHLKDRGVLLEKEQKISNVSYLPFRDSARVAEAIQSLLEIKRKQGQQKSHA